MIKILLSQSHKVLEITNFLSFCGSEAWGQVAIISFLSISTWLISNYSLKKPISLSNKKMVVSGGAEICDDSDYGRERELKAFVESKAGVKGLVDAGVTKVPRMFIPPPTLRAFQETQSVQCSVPVMEFDSEHWVVELERGGVRRRLRALVDGVSTGVRNRRGREDRKSPGFSCSFGG